MITAGIPGHFQEVGLPVGEIGVHDESTAPRQTTQGQTLVLVGFTKAYLTAVHLQVADLAVLDHGPTPLIGQRQACHIFQAADKTGMVIQAHIRGRAFFGTYIPYQLSVVDAQVRRGVAHHFQQGAVAAREGRTRSDLDTSPALTAGSVIALAVIPAGVSPRATSDKTQGSASPLQLESPPCWRQRRKAE